MKMSIEFDRMRSGIIGFTLFAAIGACGASGRADRTRDQPATAGAGGSGGSGQAGGAGATGGVILDVDAGGETSSVASQGRCSADLRNVLDSAGDVAETCADDQGCAGGRCVSACAAAAHSTGSIGCEFWAPDPPFFQNGRGTEEDGPCYAVFIANAWTRPAKISVSRGDLSFDLSSFGRIPHGVAPNTRYDPIPPSGLPANEVAVLFLSHKPGSSNANTSLECPVAPALPADAAVAGSGKGSAFHVVSDTPVSAYDILPYGGAFSYLPSATLLLPATAWGTNYIGVTPRNDGSGSLWALVVSREDGTHVSVAPTGDLPGGGAIAPAPVNAVTSYLLNAGESIQWLDAAPGSLVDPTGTVFQSDKPIGLWTGNTFLRVATLTSPEGGYQDAAHQQIPHVKALGHEYVGSNIVTRLPSREPESVPYRLLGVTDHTLLQWDPSPPEGAPTALGAGEMAEFETTKLFSVRSQDSDHPFVFTQYMPGTIQSGTLDDCGLTPSEGLRCVLGDEDWLNLVPPEQFLSRYIFFTDPTYATTNLVLIRVKGEDGFSDVNVDCIGTIAGWQPVGGAGQFEVADVDLVRGTVPVGTCGTSRHEASSAGSFGILVWGTDWASSYGYPAGGNLAAINEIVVPTVVR